MAKRGLYDKVDKLRSVYPEYNLRQGVFAHHHPCFPLDVLALPGLHSDSLYFEVYHYNSRLIGGVLAKKMGGTSYMRINGRRCAEQQRFDCAHELIHFHFHPDDMTFTCYDLASGLVFQDKYMEWEANEGAAELLMPYRLFVPIVGDLYTAVAHGEGVLLASHGSIISYLMQLFGVSAQMVRMRMDGLAYEIYQYVKGVSVDDLRVLSRREQRKAGLNAPSVYAYLAGLPSQVVYMKGYYFCGHAPHSL